MKVGVVLPLFSGDPALVLRVAREAEELGYDGAFVFDHFFPPGAPRDRASLEAFAMLAAVAATCPRMTIGTLVTRASIRPPGLLAKTAAWIDHASGGRLVLGIGTGDPLDRAEHEAYGIPMPGKRERREHLEETIVALKALFEGASYAGGERVPPLMGPLRPAPARPGGPPVWIGGQADEMVRLAGRVADGWNGWGSQPSAFEKKATILREEAEAHGRAAEATWAGIVLTGSDGAEIHDLIERRRARGIEESAWTGTSEELVGFLGELEAAGASWAAIVPAGPRDRMALIGTEVLPKLRSAAPHRSFR